MIIAVIIVIITIRTEPPLRFQQYSIDLKPIGRGRVCLEGAVQPAIIVTKDQTNCDQMSTWA